VDPGGLVFVILVFGLSAVLILTLPSRRLG
jgi:hypothetical protein